MSVPYFRSLFPRVTNLLSRTKKVTLFPFQVSSISTVSLHIPTNFERHFSSVSANSSTSKLLAVLKSEYEQEKSGQVEGSSKLEKFLNSNDWKCETKVGDVNITFSKIVKGKKVSVDFQLVNPNLNGEEGDEEGMEGEEGEGETTDFSVTIENLNENKDGESSINKSGGGVTFYCTTVAGDKFRYLIGNIRLFRNEEEKNLVSAFNGPEFEGLSPSLQENLENYLETYGVNNDLCDAIDEMAIIKETKEYINWLEGFIDFVKK